MVADGARAMTDKHGQSMDNRAVFAAIDMGSHSFELCVKQCQDHRWQVLASSKERVRLMDGLDANNRLSEAAIGRALQTLSRFQQILHDYPLARVRAVGTKALRTATNADRFVRQVELLFGWPVDIVQGLEEARLIYQGVRAMGDWPEHLFVIDVGGGSTEFIVGQDRRPLILESLSVGCLSVHRQYFAGQPLNRETLDHARLALENALLPIAEQVSWHHWELALGCSGSLEALIQVQAALGGATDRLTTDGLRRLEEDVLSYASWSELASPGLDDERRQLVPAATTMARAFFNQFGLEELVYCPAALKDGVIQELYDERLADKARYEGVVAFARHHRIDIEHIDRLIQTLRRFVVMVDAGWNLGPRDLALLRCAAWLHEIGKNINVHGYPRHSAYLVHNAELPGFTQREQQRLATLVRWHAGPLKETGSAQATGVSDNHLWRLLRLFRLAVIQCSDRTDDACLELNLSTCGETLVAQVQVLHAERARVLMAALEREAQYQQEAGWSLQLQPDLNLHKI